MMRTKGTTSASHLLRALRCSHSVEKLSLNRTFSGVSSFMQSIPNIKPSTDTAVTTKFSEYKGSRKESISDALLRVDSALRVPGTVNADHLIKDLQLLHRYGATIPLTYAMDIVNLLANRSDGLRVELIVQTMIENYSKYEINGAVNNSFSNNAIATQDSSLRLQEIINEPINVLISHAINTLFATNNNDHALKLWERMTSIGFITTRENLEQMLDALINTRTSTPTIQFVDKIHNSMKNNLWHQNPEYYSRILRVYRQILIGSKRTTKVKTNMDRFMLAYNPNVVKNTKMSLDELKEVVNRMDTLWKEATELFSSNEGGKGSQTSNFTVDLLATRTHCHVAANHKLRQIIGIQPTNELTTQYLNNALKSYTDFLTACGRMEKDGHLADKEGVKSGATAKESDSLLHKMTSEMQSILSNVNYSSGDYPLVGSKISNEQQIPLDILASGSERLEQERFLKENMDKYFSATATPTSSVSDTDPLQMPSELLHSTHLIRLGFSQLPIELARQGKITEALNVFESYLKVYFQREHTEKEIDIANVLLYSNTPNSLQKQNNGGVISVSNKFFTSAITNQRKSSRDVLDNIIEGLSLKSALGMAKISLPPRYEKVVNTDNKTGLSTLNNSVDAKKKNSSIRLAFVDNTSTLALNNKNTPYRNKEALFTYKKDIEFFEYVLCEIVSNMSVLNHILHDEKIAFLVEKNSDFVESRIFATLFDSVTQCEEIAMRYNIPLSSSFYACHIDALWHNAEQINKAVLHSGLTKNTDKKVTWSSCLTAAYHTVDALPESVGRSPVMNHAIIRMLCKFKEPAALFKAISIVQDVNNAAKSFSTTDSINQNAVLPESFYHILMSATNCLTNEDLSRVLAEIESLVTAPDSKLKSDVDAYNLVLKARIMANCRLCKGHNALALFKEYRQLGGHVADASLYEWVITALYFTSCDGKQEWNVTCNPDPLVEWFLVEMQRDGIKLTGDLLATVLLLYSKAIQIDYIQNNSMGAVQLMEKCVKKCMRGEYNSHAKIDMTESIIKELVRTYCIIDRVPRAFELLNVVEDKYPKLKVTGSVYEEMLFTRAVKQDNIPEGESILQIMKNKGIKPTPPCVDAMVTAYIQKEKPQDALNVIENVYRHGGVPCTVPCVLRLLDSVLVKGNVVLAKKVVKQINEMYTDEIRLKAMDKVDSVLLEARHSDLSEQDQLALLANQQQQLSTKQEETVSASVEVVGEAVKDEDDSIDVTFTRPVAVENGEEGEEEVDEYTKKVYPKLDRFGRPKRDHLLPRLYYHNLKTPKPRTQGSLTEGKLQERFQKYGLKMN